MKRKNFIQLSATALALSLIESHYKIPGTSTIVQPIKEGKPLIKSLRLMTASPLEEMKRFYNNVIGFPVLKESLSELTVSAGETAITFIKTDNKAARPFYHFAFNIPENKIDQAFQWQRNKTAVIHPSPEGKADAVVNFAHWNAHSIFFHDPAGNLLEYIARHDLNNKAEGGFSVKDILYASEIAFIVDDVIKEGESLLSAMQLKEYKPGGDGFWPIGDEHGLLLVIRKGRIWAGRPGQLNKTDIFPTEVQINSSFSKTWKISTYPYDISAGKI